MKKILIIGATSGLGRGIAETYIRRGCDVGVMGRRQALLDELVAMGEGRVKAAVCDVTADDAVARVEALVREMGGVDCLVLSSGVGRQNPALDYALERPTLLTNVAGWTAIVDWAYRYFQQQGHGHLAAISSIAARSGARPCLFRHESLSSALSRSPASARQGQPPTPLHHRHSSRLRRYAPAQRPQAVLLGTEGRQSRARHRPRYRPPQRRGYDHSPLGLARPLHESSP